MSFRGGRGGFRGGRGGKPGGGPIMPRELDVKPDFGPTEQFPEFIVPIANPLTSEERIWVSRFIDHREKIHNGPLYTVLGKRKGMEDPFSDVVTWSKRYHKQRRKVPKLDSRPYVFEFFPAELYSTLDPSASRAPHQAAQASSLTTRQRDKKRLLISSLNTTIPNGAISESEAEDDEDETGENGTKSKAKASILASLMNGGDEDDEGAGLSGDNDNADDDDDEGGERGEEEEENDEYQDDEEGDYNAEQYFDDGEGEDDFGDEDGGGGAWYD